jgi:hypothetical protein
MQRMFQSPVEKFGEIFMNSSCNCVCIYVYLFMYLFVYLVCPVVVMSVGYVCMELKSLKAVFISLFI